MIAAGIPMTRRITRSKLTVLKIQVNTFGDIPIYPLLRRLPTVPIVSQLYKHPSFPHFSCPAAGTRRPPFSSASSSYIICSSLRIRSSVGGWVANQLAEEPRRSEEHTSELQSRGHLVCRLLLEKKK